MRVAGELDGEHQLALGPRRRDDHGRTEPAAPVAEQKPEARAAAQGRDDVRIRVAVEVAEVERVLRLARKELNRCEEAAFAISTDNGDLRESSASVHHVLVAIAVEVEHVRRLGTARRHDRRRLEANGLRHGPRAQCPDRQNDEARDHTECAYSERDKLEAGEGHARLLSGK